MRRLAAVLVMVVFSATACGARATAPSGVTYGTVAQPRGHVFVRWPVPRVTLCLNGRIRNHDL